MKEFQQIQWDQALEDDCYHLIRLAVREDLDRGFDWTTIALVPEEARGQARIVARQDGVIAGLPAVDLALREMETDLHLDHRVADGDEVYRDDVLAEIKGSVRDLLTAERIALNLLGHMSGIATLTRRYVDAVQGTRAAIYDTRKTTPAWRRLEKYAVRCGRGKNHRLGLFAAVMIKDNHLAFASQAGLTAGQAVRQLRVMLPSMTQAADEMIVEVEVDTVEQLRDVLSAGPDIVLLDNMSCEQMRECVRLRDSLASQVQIEASGGVNLQTIQAIAETGVERISVGALTHSAPQLDVGLDFF